MDAVARREPFASKVEAAQQRLTDAIARAGLQRDPYRHVFEAMSDTLGVLVDFNEELQKGNPKLLDAHVNRIGAMLVQAASPRANDMLSVARGKVLSGIFATWFATLLLGIFVGWFLFGAPSGMQCQVQSGGYVCFAWVKPATSQPAG